MAVIDSKWAVPENYDVTERVIALPPPRGQSPTSPMLAISSVRALEDQATGNGLFSLFAWQRIAGHDALHTIEPLTASAELSGLEQLLLGHALAATGLADAFAIAQKARKSLKAPISGNSVDAGLLLAVTALPHGVERVRTLLDMLLPDLSHGTDEHRAIHALVRAAADSDPAKLDEAYAKFAALDDSFGLAQCALVAHMHEIAAGNNAELVRAYLEYATYRLEADGRPEWAARTLSHGLVPALVQQNAAPAAVAAVLGRAVALAGRAKSYVALESVFRIAAKHGYSAIIAQLSQFEPPVFTHKDATPPAPEAPAEAEKPKKKAAAKRGKKSAQAEK